MRQGLKVMWEYNNVKRMITFIFQTCNFMKFEQQTYLYVHVSSNMRIAGCSNCCKRWYVTFNGSECTPVPIDGVVYMHAGTGSQFNNLHRPRVVAGHCKINKKGRVNVALNVGDCPNHNGGDAHTGWDSATRIHVEEMEPPQQWKLLAEIIISRSSSNALFTFPYL